MPPDNLPEVPRLRLYTCLASPSRLEAQETFLIVPREKGLPNAHHHNSGRRRGTHGGTRESPAFAASPSAALAGSLAQAAAAQGTLRHDVQYCARRRASRCGYAPYWAGPGPSSYYGAYPVYYSGYAPAYPVYQPYPAGYVMAPAAPVYAPAPVVAYAPAPVVAAPVVAAAPAYGPTVVAGPAPYAPTPVVTTQLAFPFSPF